MIAAVRSELTRLGQPRLLITWFGLMALFAMLVNTIMVTFVSGGGSLPPGAPGVAFPTLAEMESPSGLMAGLAAASNMFGIVTLSLLGRRDRERLQQRPHPPPRRRGAAPLARCSRARSAPCWSSRRPPRRSRPSSTSSPSCRWPVPAGISTAAWGTDLVAVVGGAWVNLYLSLCVWGVLGLVHRHPGPLRGRGDLHRRRLRPRRRVARSRW